jgi:hypothetical protein
MDVGNPVRKYYIDGCCYYNLIGPPGEGSDAEEPA